MNLRKRIASLVAFITLTLTLHGQGFLKTEGKYIVNDKGEKIIFRGMGLGGWMLQEGYMLRVQGIGHAKNQKATVGGGSDWPRYILPTSIKK